MTPPVSDSRWRGVARWTSLTFRLFAIALIVLSPWLAPRARPSHLRSVVFVVDRSASIGAGLGRENEILAEAWAARGDAALGVVAFDGSAELVAPVGTRTTPSVGKGPSSSASDLAGAIRLARAALPIEGHRSIVLLTDGRPTRGDARDEVRRTAELGIRVDTVAIEGESLPLPYVVSVEPRRTQIAEHQPVALDVVVRADTSFVVTWTRDGLSLPPQSQYVEQKPRSDDEPSDPSAGPSETVHKVELVDPNPPSGVHVYEVTVVGQPEFGLRGVTKPIPTGPSALASVSVDGRAHAAVFSQAGDVPPILKAALEEAGLEARSLPIERASDPSSWSGADLVILADIRLSASDNDESGLTRASQTALVEWVQQGGGLLVTGGAFGLAPEWMGAPLARALPVEIENRGHVEDPPVALAIMLDRSGSMGAMVGSHTKLELAIEASLGAAEVLRPTDQLALASIDTVTSWDIPLGPAARVSAMKETVRNVPVGGGGIFVYTALRDAYNALASVKTPIRHVILFSDTSDSEEQTDQFCTTGRCTGKTAESLAREARVKGITTTVVGIGEEEAQDTPFLRRLAAAAGGRFYLTSEGTDLRRIFLSETRVLAQSNLREETVPVLAMPGHPVLEGIPESKLPRIGSFVEAGRRAGADTALVLGGHGEGRPLLATWRYGLGKVGAMTTELSEGIGTDWAKSPEAAKVLKQTVRFLLRQSDAHRADAEVRVRGKNLEVSIELPPDAPESQSPRSVEAYAVEKSGRSRTIPLSLEAVGPGRWVARGRSGGEPILIARVRDARGAVMAEATGREDRTLELVGGGADKRLLEDLARVGEGRVDPEPKATLDPTHHPARTLVATWPYALVAAAMLVVLDLVLRRVGRPRRGAPTVQKTVRSPHQRPKLDAAA